METVTVTICNWTDYQTRKDIKNPSWFRLENKIYGSQSLYGLSAAERWVWICLLCLASENGNSELKITLDWFEDQTKAKRKEITSALKKLTERGAIRTDAYADVRARTDTLSDRQTDKQTDITEQTNTASAGRTNSIASEVERIYRECYPRKEGAGRGIARAVREIRDPTTLELFEKAVIAYRDKVIREKTEVKFMKHFPTFVTEWRDFLDPLTGTHIGERKKTAKEIYDEMEAREKGAASGVG